MTYLATIVNVMIASPSDVAQERRLVRDVIADWNAVHTEDKQVVLMPVGWESHSSPQMGQRPQEVINNQILAKCDLLIAAFWTRLGSPTGEAPSGTVEEIEEHIKAGKPAMLYFSSAPVHPDSVDHEQYSALKKFKDECRQKGLVEEYESVTEFREKLTRQLAQTINWNFSPDRSEEGNGAELSSLSGSKITLSEEAKELLLEAAQDESGVIMRLGTMDGTHVQTNKREFSDLGNPRSEAKWRAAVDELHGEDLIEDRAGKGEVFFMTNKGYEVVEKLESPT